MSHLEKRHVTPNLPDWNKNFRTDPAHIQKSSNGNRVEPVVLPKDRIIRYPSGSLPLKHLKLSGEHERV